MPLQYGDKNMEIHSDFFQFYNAPTSREENVFNCIKDALCKIPEIPTECLQEWHLWVIPNKRSSASQFGCSEIIILATCPTRWCILIMATSVHVEPLQIKLYSSLKCEGMDLSQAQRLIWSCNERSNLHWCFVKHYDYVSHQQERHQSQWIGCPWVCPSSSMKTEVIKLN